MKKEIVATMKIHLSVDLYQLLDERHDLDELAHKLDRLFREGLASREDSIDPYGPDTIRESLL